MNTATVVKFSVWLPILVAWVLNPACINTNTQPEVKEEVIEREFIRADQLVAPSELPSARVTGGRLMMPIDLNMVYVSWSDLIEGIDFVSFDEPIGLRPKFSM